MSVMKLTDKDRKRPWRARVRGKAQMFFLKEDAERWEREQEREWTLTGLPPTIETLKKYTLGDIVSRYLKDITPTKGCHQSEAYVLNRFLKRPICSMSLASFRDKQEGHNYVTERLKETWKSPRSKGKAKLPNARTVSREINTIRNIFEVAKEKWGHTNLFNPFAKLGKGTAKKHKRRRRLQDGELSRLEKACDDCRGLNKYYVRLAIYLAIETGMRLQEIFNLSWGDVDIVGRRIHILKSKTDHESEYDGREIVIPLFALRYLAGIRLTLKEFKADERIFPMTKGAFQQSWVDVRRRAGIKADRRGEMLEFKDLRREAGSRFDEVGLTKAEHDLMMGHADKSMASVYIASKLKTIQDKLDRSVLGMTLEEAAARAEKEGPPTGDKLIELMEFLASKGLQYELSILEQWRNKWSNKNAGSNVVKLTRAS